MAFYGRAPHPSGAWQDVPAHDDPGGLWSYARLLPKLDAERQLAEINLLLAAGQRAVDDTAHRQLIRELDAAAGGGSVRRATRANPAALAQMRLGGRQAVTRVKHDEETGAAGMSREAFLGTAKPGQRPGQRKEGGVR